MLELELSRCIYAAVKIALRQAETYDMDIVDAIEMLM